MQKIFFILILTGWLTGCKKYLDIQPRDLKLAQSVKDYEDLLNGEGFKKQLSTTGWEDLNILEFLSDDVMSQMGTLATDSRTRYSSYYVWRNNYEEDHLTGGLSQLNATLWQYLYKIANVANIVIAEVDDVPGPESERNFVKADAYFTRALAYYFIINIWGQPYIPATAATDKGVPVKLTNYAEFSGLPRKSVKEGYEQIVNDLENAEKHITAAGIKKGIFSVSREAVYLLLSRVHLYMQNWEEAVDYATKCLQIKSDLYNLIPETFTTTNTTSFLNPRNNEIIFTFYNRPANFQEMFGTALGRHYSISNELYNVYVADDKRRSAYFLSNTGVPATRAARTSWKAEGVKSYNQYFRTAEAYLNRAEANIQLNNLTAAADDFNHLRKFRIANVTDVTFANKETALTTIYDERRRELAFQLHRWFDLRRTTRPRLVHQWRQTTSTPILNFVLEENDPGYTLEIPQSELRTNSVIEPLGLQIREPQ
ncbi:MAG TPA: RagB/SusD family nutrient uptake outer membrane protein [Parasegetibacter sp.]